MNRLGASSPTKALRRGGGSGGHVSDVVDVRENKSTNPATMAMHRLTMSLGSWPSSNCCCHPFQTDGLHHLVQKGRCCRAAGAVVAFVPEEIAAGRGLRAELLFPSELRVCLLSNPSYRRKKVANEMRKKRAKVRTCFFQKKRS